MSIKVIAAVMETDIPDGIAKLVAMVLADWANTDTGRCWPKIPTLAQQCSQSERTVQRKLRLLEELGLLTIEPNQTGDRKGNAYVLHLGKTAQPPTGDRIDLMAPEPRTGDTQSPVAGGVRVADRHPTGDNAVTPRVTLQSPPIENPSLESVKEESPHPPGGGKSASRKLLRGNGVTAPVEPVQGGGRRSAPSLDPPTAERFARLWVAYPEGGRIDTNRAAAEAIFAELPPAEQDLAVVAAAGYSAHIAKHRGRSNSLQTWLRQRRFANLGASVAPIAGGVTGRVFVAEDSPAWNAWQDHLQTTTGRGSPVTERRGVRGWSFESQWPAGHQLSAAVA